MKVFLQRSVMCDSPTGYFLAPDQRAADKILDSRLSRDVRMLVWADPTTSPDWLEGGRIFSLRRLDPDQCERRGN